MSEIRLLPVDSVIFKAVDRWCKCHNKTPSEAFTILFDVEDSTKRDDLMRAYYYIVGKEYSDKHVPVDKDPRDTYDRYKTKWIV